MSTLFSFPFHFAMIETMQDISCGEQCQVFDKAACPNEEVIAHPVIFTSPVHLRVKDLVLIDLRNGQVEMVQRAGIAIWRRGWLN